MKIRKNQLPILTKQKNFDSFWQRTLLKLESVALNIELEEYSYPSKWMKVYQITCHGLLNEKLRGWYILPNFNPDEQQEYPVVIEFPGYMSTIGEPTNYLHWIMLGCAVLTFDMRGQGGKTFDNAPYETYSAPPPIVRGLLSPEDYYQRRLFADAYRIVEVAKDLQPHTPTFVTGASQGGALTMIAAALAKDKVQLALPDVASSSNIFSRIDHEQGCFKEIAQYLRYFPEDLDVVYEVQSYFDTMNFADKIECPVYASVGGKDSVCPAENYLATFERIQTDKQLFVYHFNGHEGGGQQHLMCKLRLIEQFLNKKD